MSLIKDNYMVEKLSAAASNPALRDPILPRTSETGPLGFDPTGYQEDPSHLCRILRHDRRPRSDMDRVPGMPPSIAALSKSCSGDP